MCCAATTSASGCAPCRGSPGKTPRDIRAAIWDSGFEDEADSGGYPDPDTYLTEFGSRIGHPI